MCAHFASRDPKSAAVGRHRRVVSAGQKLLKFFETATARVRAVERFIDAIADLFSTSTRLIRSIVGFAATVAALYIAARHGIGWP